MKKRTEKDIWKNLYDFPLIELDQTTKVNNIHYKKKLISIIGSKEVNIEKIKYYEHKLTHQKLHITINYIKSNKSLNNDIFVIVNKLQALNFPVPKPIELFFKELFNSLDCEL